MKEVYENARKMMKGFCRVCPVCDGRACVGEVPGMGGLGTASSFHANIQALARHRFAMRLIHDVVEPALTTNFFGTNLSLPVLAAPIGGVSFNMGGGISEDAYIESVLNGCLSKGTLGCTGDGVPAFIHETGFSTIQKLGGKGIPFIKPWDEKELFEKIAKAQQAGATIVGMDIDAAGLVTLRKMGRPVGPKTVAELEKVRQAILGKFILKGIMTEDDARRAVDAGVDGIVVSNHGGRVLDYSPGTAEVLPRIAQAVAGKLMILVDGGVRSGADVLKMLALGAQVVLIGRPFSVAAVGGLQQGVESYLDKIRVELQQYMVLTGTPSVQKVNPQILC